MGTVRMLTLLGPALIVGGIGNGVVVRLIQPVAPETRQPQPLMMSLGSPSSHGNVDLARFVIAYHLERWQHVSVRGHDHADIVGTVYRKLYEVDGQGNVDTLLLSWLLWPSAWVSEASRYYCRPV